MRQALGRASVERQKAARAGERATEHEALAESGLPAPLPEFHEHVAAVHRRSEQRHLVACRIHLEHAQILQRWARSDTPTSRPGLITAVAGIAGSHSAVLDLRGREGAEGLVAASDATSAAAHDLEETLAEGPCHDAMTDPVPVRAVGSGLPLRWPRYGPAVREIGVAAVAAVGLRTTKICLGALAVFDPQSPSSQPPIAELTDIAGALVYDVLLDPEAIGSAAGVATLRQFETENSQPVLHQAAGKIHAECDCGIDPALALVRAHAFAANRPAAEVAHDVVRGVLTLP